MDILIRMVAEQKEQQENLAEEQPPLFETIVLAIHQGFNFSCLVQILLEY